MIRAAVANYLKYEKNPEFLEFFTAKTPEGIIAELADTADQFLVNIANWRPYGHGEYKAAYFCEPLGVVIASRHSLRFTIPGTGAVIDPTNLSSIGELTRHGDTYKHNNGLEFVLTNPDTAKTNPKCFRLEFAAPNGEHPVKYAVQFKSCDDVAFIDCYDVSVGEERQSTWYGHNGAKIE